MLSSVSPRNLVIRLESPVPSLLESLASTTGAKGTGSRVLSEGMGRVTVKILDASDNSVLYSGDADICDDGNGNVTAGLRSPNLPSGASLDVTCQVLDGSGEAYLSAETRVDLGRTETRPHTLDLTLAPVTDYSHLDSLDGWVGTDTLVLDAGDVLVYQWNPAASFVGYSTRLSWDTVDEGISVGTCGADGSSRTVRLLDDGKSGLVYSTSDNGTVYLILANTGTQTTTLSSLAWSANSLQLAYHTGTAVSGSAPAAISSLYEGDEVTAADNDGNLALDNSIFLGWTTATDGYGEIYAPGTTITVSGDTDLYPAWMVMKPVPGGTFQRNATGMSWYMAVAFCNRLSMLQGLDPVYSLGGSTDPDAWGTIPTSTDAAWNLMTADRNATGYRLPTEMEWMWAAMGGLSDCISGDVVDGVNTGGYNKDFAGSDGTNAIGDYCYYGGIYTPATVRSKLPNELGLYDMSGNEYEYCQDWYASWPSGSLTDYCNNNRNGTERMLKGGASQDDADECTLAYRNSWQPSATYTDFGFRVVRPAAGSTYLPRSGLVLECLMDNFSGSTMADTSGNGLDISLVNACSNGTSRNGTATSTLTCAENSSANATLAHSPLLAFGSADAFSVSLWLNTDSLPDNYYKYLFSQSASAGEPDYGIILSRDGLNAVVDKNCYYSCGVLFENILTNTWYHAVLVYKDYTVYLFVDGTLVGSTSFTAGEVSANTISPMNLGSGSVEYFAGSLDNLRVYNRALSAEEVVQLYQETP